MIQLSSAHWISLEQRSSTLFLVAGTLLVGYATINGLEAFTAATFEQNLFEAGYAVGFLGLLGLYPSLAGRSPWLARTGAATAVLGLVAFSVFTVANLVEFAGVALGALPGEAVFILMAAAGFVVGYLAVGVAVLRSGAYPRTIGLLLLVPGVIIILMFATMAAGVASPETVFVVSGGQAMTHLAIGSTLKVESEPADQKEAESVSDATARG